MDSFYQFIRFAGVGAIGTIAHYVTLIILVQCAGANPIGASTTGFVLGAFINYYLNYHYTFRSTRNHQEAMTKFFTVAVVGVFSNGAFMALATEILALPYLIAQVLATGMVLIWNFVANRLWTFR